ncbi:hypothetical protein LP422_21140 [Janibacter limosus]|uniref:Uncharacterized protein n=1 Tax=Janibacter limosus TaxID=53458 RepID=A0AC61U477_9MICO|nr:hypothetical protein [Janibacter limosus]UUZ44768.1 hypothetical protein LP422_21140 [Janibacter limosus]
MTRPSHRARRRSRAPRGDVEDMSPLDESAVCSGIARRWPDIRPFDRLR